LDVPESYSPSATSLAQLSPTDPLHDIVLRKFNDAWLHPMKQRPNVHSIYQIALSSAACASFLLYLAAAEAKGQFVARGLPKGNQILEWHGTRRTCNLGDDPNALRLCTDVSCATCGIIRTSFDSNLLGTAPGRNLARFGKGHYTTVSSKADDYHVSSRSPYRSLILARVVQGRAKGLSRANASIRAAPSGYDSVVGLIGVELNYGETCVYTDDAIRPAFLVLYK